MTAWDRVHSPARAARRRPASRSRRSARTPRTHSLRRRRTRSHDLPDARGRNAAAEFGRIAVLGAGLRLPFGMLLEHARPGPTWPICGQASSTKPTSSGSAPCSTGGPASSSLLHCAAAAVGDLRVQRVVVQMLDVEHTQRRLRPRLRRRPGCGQRRAVGRRRPAQRVEQQPSVGHGARHRPDARRSPAAAPAACAGAARRSARASARRGRCARPGAGSNRHRPARWPAARCRRPPRPPRRRWSRRASASGSRGCRWRRTAGSRCSRRWRTRARWSCRAAARRRRGPGPAASSS